MENVKVRNSISTLDSVLLQRRNYRLIFTKMNFQTKETLKHKDTYT